MNQDAMEVFRHEPIMPRDIVTLGELNDCAEHIQKVLLESHNALEAYIIVKQMERVVKQLLESLNDGALSRTEGKEGDVSGWKYQVRSIRQYEYEAPTLGVLDAKKKEIDEKLKTIKKFVESGQIYIDPETGAENRAQLVSEGSQIFITAPKK